MSDFNLRDIFPPSGIQEGAILFEEIVSTGQNIFKLNSITVNAKYPNNFSVQQYIADGGGEATLSLSNCKPCDSEGNTLTEGDTAYINTVDVIPAGTTVKISVRLDVSQLNDITSVYKEVTDLIKGQIANEVGSFRAFDINNTPNPLYFLPVNGAEVSRELYPNLWKKVQDVAVSEEVWQQTKGDSSIGACMLYSTGNGTTTFRIPTVGLKGGFGRAIGTDGNAPIGNFEGGFEDQIQNITGAVDGDGEIMGWSPNGSGAFRSHRENVTSLTSGTSVSNLVNSIDFDASRVARTGEETSPKGFYYKLYICTGNTVPASDLVPFEVEEQVAENTTAIGDLENKVGGGCLGVGQSWQNVTAQRVSGAIYTNFTGKPIAVAVRTGTSAPNLNAHIGYYVYINGHLLLSNTNGGVGTWSGVSVFFIVPKNGTYSVVKDSAQTLPIDSWIELR